MPGIQLPDLERRQQNQIVQTNAQIDQFNQALRANPEYQAFLRSIGANPSGPLTLTGTQRAVAEQWVRQHVGDIGHLQIDPAGNANQDQGFSRQAKDWGPAVGGSALALFGIPGLFPGALNSAGPAVAGQASEAADGLLPNVSRVPLGSVALDPPGLAGAGGVAGGGGVGAATVTAGASGGIDAIRKSLTDPRTYAALAPLVASLATSGGGNSAAGGSDELRRIQAITEARMRRVDPLHQVATQLAFQRAPIAAKQGINLANITLPG